MDRKQAGDLNALPSQKSDFGSFFWYTVVAAQFSPIAKHSRSHWFLIYPEHRLASSHTIPYIKYWNESKTLIGLFNYRSRKWRKYKSSSPVHLLPCSNMYHLYLA